MTEVPCIVCSSNVNAQQSIPSFRRAIDCPACGRFTVNERAVTGMTPENRAKLSGAIRQACERGEYLEITEYNVGVLLANAPDENDVDSKAQFLLRAISRRTRPGTGFDLTFARDEALCFATDRLELAFYARTLEGLGLVTIEGQHSEAMHVSLTSEGWVRSKMAPDQESTKAFVAMAFSPETLAVYLESIEPAIKACGYTPLRIDQEQHNEMIDDRIQAEIRESRFVVADLTLHRNGVYFEAGFAKGLGKPVIWTCRDDHEKETHLDTRQYNRIHWNKPADLRETLEFRIRATIGRGPLQAP